MLLTATHLGTGPRIALVHGFTQTAESWHEIAADLSRDHEVVSIDAPGHGGSSEVRTAFTAAAQQLAMAGGQATYVGYSMGARLCLHVALTVPIAVERLVVLGATAGIEDAAERAQRQSADDHLADSIEADGVEAFLDRWLAQPMFANVPDDRARRRHHTATGLASSLRLVGTGAQEPLWDRLSELTMPVLVLAGTNDGKFTALGHRIAATIGDNATFASISDAGHAAHLENRTGFLATVRDWLAAHPPRTGTSGRRREASPFQPSGREPKPK